MAACNKQSPIEMAFKPSHSVIDKLRMIEIFKDKSVRQQTEETL